VLALAIAVMPLQGIAASISVLACHGEADAHAVHGQDTQHGHHAQDQHDEDTGSNNDPAFHLCCHLTAPGLAGMTSVPAMPDFALPATSPQPLHDLFVPDRPQRPPLA